MADSKNDPKKTHTTQDSSKTRTTEDSVGGERLHRPQSFQKLPSPSESDTGQQGSDSSASMTDATSKDSSASKTDTTSSDSSKDTDKK